MSYRFIQSDETIYFAEYIIRNDGVLVNNHDGEMSWGQFESEFEEFQGQIEKVAIATTRDDEVIDWDDYEPSKYGFLGACRHCPENRVVLMVCQDQGDNRLIEMWPNGF